MILTSFRCSRSRTYRISRRPQPENRASQVLQTKHIKEKAYSNAAVMFYSYFTFFKLKNWNVFSHINHYISTAAWPQYYYCIYRDAQLKLEESLPLFISTFFFFVTLRFLNLKTTFCCNVFGLGSTVAAIIMVPTLLQIM